MRSANGMFDMEEFVSFSVLKGQPVQDSARFGDEKYGFLMQELQTEARIGKITGTWGRKM
jgi:hypothetical protein